MSVDDDDRRLHSVGLTADESALDNTNSSKRCRTHLMIPAQTEPEQAADEDEEMGLHIFDSRDLTEGAQDIQSLDTTTAAAPGDARKNIRAPKIKKRHQGPKRKYTNDQRREFRSTGWKSPGTPKSDSAL